MTTLQRTLTPLETTTKIILLCQIYMMKISFIEFQGFFILLKVHFTFLKYDLVVHY